MERYNISSHIFTPYSFLLPFEQNYTNADGNLWMQNNWKSIVYYVTAYLALIYIGQLYMKSRPRYELRWPLFLWNLLLTVFSFTGAIRMLPELFYTLRVHGFHHSVCKATLLDINVTAFWVFAFSVSKVFEMGDTLFIVLRKNKLTFLHVFHHAVVAISAWYIFKEKASVGRWMISVNYTVHSIMYCYYTLKTLKVPVTRRVSMMITILQTAQMFFGCFVCMFALQDTIRNQNCQLSTGVAAYTVALYISQIVLFLNFFHAAYIRPKISVKTD